MVASAAAPEDLSRICQGCGLCCNGTLFAMVELEQHELDRAPRHSLPLVPGEAAFSLPCPKYERGHGCSIYDDRPERCRSYRCGLLKAVVAGERTVEQQLQRVERVQLLIARCKDKGVEIRQAVGDGMDLARQGAATLVGTDAAELMLDVSEIGVILKRDYGAAVE
ncbi:MAG TPA: YkgJ family cysteine cluster protein [Polyangiaceae bacterium]|nr:YkgJ family cysteine cluster protein [Polyangiaceae bacterium]